MQFTPDTDQMQRFIRLLHPGDTDVYELRAFDQQGRTLSGYFNDLDAFTKEAARIAPDAQAIYATLNEIDPALIARRANRVVRCGKSDPLTSDGNVIHRTTLPIDLDVVRPSGISSTDEEHEAAKARGREIYRYLKQCEWPEPLVCDSGNGCHLLYRIDEPTDDGELVKRVLNALAIRFDDAAVKVDCSLINPSRIIKVAGTPVRKGDPTAERPHRLSSILSAPAQLSPVTHELLVALAAELPEESRPSHGAGIAPKLDVPRFLADAGMVCRSEQAAGDGTRYRLDDCPSCQERGVNAWVWQSAAGALAAGCFNSDCGLTWQVLRERFPDALQRQRPARSAAPRAATPWDNWQNGNHHASDNPEGEPASFVWHTGAEIAAATPTITPKVAPPYILAGAVHELTATIKVGKTTVAMSLVRAVLTNGVFLGQQVDRCGPVVYLTEEPKAAFQAALKRAAIDSQILYVMYRGEARGVPWEAIAAEASRKALEVGAMLMVVDTLSGWAGFAVDAENDAGAAGLAMRPLQDAAAAGLAVLVNRHDRKGGGEIGESGRGSSAFGGTADVLLHLTRANTEGHPNRRTLDAVGRFDDIPPKLTIEWDGTDYLVLGDTVDVERRAVREWLLEHLPPTKEQAITEIDIITSLGPSGKRTTVRRVLTEEVEAGTIHREAAGFGKTKRAAGYWRELSTDEPTGNKSNDVSNKDRTLVTSFPTPWSESTAGKSSDQPRTPGQLITEGGAGKSSDQPPLLDGQLITEGGEKPVVSGPVASHGGDELFSPRTPEKLIPVEVQSPAVVGWRCPTGSHQYARLFRRGPDAPWLCTADQCEAVEVAPAASTNGANGEWGET